MLFPNILENRDHPRHHFAHTICRSAWVERGDDPTVDKILQRIEHMTGLSTLTSEDLHVLNYGIGGHYDAHVDFFDLEDVSNML